MLSQFHGYQTRHMHGIDVQGTVVILDEAHNIVSHKCVLWSRCHLMQIFPSSSMLSLHFLVAKGAGVRTVCLLRYHVQRHCSLYQWRWSSAEEQGWCSQAKWWYVCLSVCVHVSAISSWENYLVTVFERDEQCSTVVNLYSSPVLKTSIDLFRKTLSSSWS